MSVPLATGSEFINLSEVGLANPQSGGKRLDLLVEGMSHKRLRFVFLPWSLRVKKKDYVSVPTLMAI